MELDIFKRRRPKLIGEDKIFRSAVCIPLIEKCGSFEILFEVRSSSIPDQPGDICLPGGAIEKGETPQKAALRELCEEILVREDQFEVIGPSDIFHTESLITYTYVGILKDYSGTHNEEAAEVFTVPLDFFLKSKPEIYPVHYDVVPGEDFPYERINGGKNYNWRGRNTCQLFYQYENRCIWGLTAKLIHAFIQIIK